MVKPGSYTCTNPEDALAFASGGGFGYPVVIKIYGPDGGKGVVLAEDRTMARAVVMRAIKDNLSEKITFEEFLIYKEGDVQ